ncbi:hypothetical protein [Variovorax paradoxus]|uniref:hypothetical protein n=1 Tax=Variovorax paradoxus TaxID=34073 RepID=UPI0029C730E6|nr:hypothetical protein [Variovorax paradoxus]WPH18248.1 hypothetical protein RZE78_14520 [Variovorax paradoxus]
MFTTHTGRRYRLPSARAVRMVRIKKSIRRACESLCIAALLVSPLLADAFLH